MKGMCRGGGHAVVKLTTFGCCDLFKSGLFTTGRAFMHQVSKSFWTTGGKGENGRLTVCFSCPLYTFPSTRD